MKIIIVLAVICSFVFITTPSKAQLSAEGFLHDYDNSKGHDKNILLFYFKGNTSGISSMNTYVLKIKKIKTYCVPRKKALNDKEKIAILRAYILKNPKEKDISLGPAVLNSLIDAFPCKKKRKRVRVIRRNRDNWVKGYWREDPETKKRVWVKGHWVKRSKSKSKRKRIKRSKDYIWVNGRWMKKGEECRELRHLPRCK